MKRLRIHNPCNEYTRYFRNYNLFWDKLTDALKQRHTVEENRYYEFANTEKCKVELQKGISDNFYLLECEYAIEDLDTGDIKVLSLADDLTHATLSERANPYLKQVLISPYIPSKIKHHVQEHIHKYSPWIYFPSNLLNLDAYYYKRKYITELNNTLYFRGTSLQDRPILQHFSSGILSNLDPILPNEYYEELIQAKIGLSIGGRGELCYRDIEYMAIGIPFLRFEYQTQLLPNLIPDYHYISVPFPTDLPKVNDLACDRLGEKHHAALLEQRFLEVRNNQEFLNFIAANARDYYEKYLSPTAHVNYTIQLLAL